MLDYINNNEITRADYNVMREVIDNSKIANSIENNQKTLYNNGESEGVLNDRYKRSIVERRNGLYEKQNEEKQRGGSGIFAQYEGRERISPKNQKYNDEQREVSKQEKIEAKRIIYNQ